MAGDLASLIKVSATVTASMIYARVAASSTRPGLHRLLSLLPVFILLPILPLSFSSLQLRTMSSFFLCWLSLSKLLLLSFGIGPLSPSLPLVTFVAIASLPVKTRPIDSPPSSKSPNNIITLLIKAVSLVLLMSVYRYKSLINRYLLQAIYFLHIYLSLEFALGSASFLARALLGLDLEPQFDAPYKSKSLQEFWGRRWNLMVTSILRPTVYDPVRLRFGPAAGVMAAFLVSGLMHEIMFCYLVLDAPTGEAVLFFLLHGLCTVVEVKARKARWYRPSPLVGAVVTHGFVAATAFWLFVPPMLRGGVEQKGLEECMELLRLMEESGMTVWKWLTG